MGNYSSFQMFENPRRGRQAKNFTTNVPKILDLKSSSEQIFPENCRWVPLKNVLWIIASRGSGSHPKVTIRSAIAKLNKRQFEARRRREFIVIATQTSKFPSDPRTHMVALIAISGIPGHEPWEENNCLRSPMIHSCSRLA